MAAARHSVRGVIAALVLLGTASARGADDAGTELVVSRPNTVLTIAAALSAAVDAGSRELQIGGASFVAGQQVLLVQTQCSVCGDGDGGQQELANTPIGRFEFARVGTYNRRSVRDDWGGGGAGACFVRVVAGAATRARAGGEALVMAATLVRWPLVKVDADSQRRPGGCSWAAEAAAGRTMSSSEPGALQVGTVAAPSRCKLGRLPAQAAFLPTASLPGFRRATTLALEEVALGERSGLGLASTSRVEKSPPAEGTAGVETPAGSREGAVAAAGSPSRPAAMRAVRPLSRVA